MNIGRLLALVVRGGLWQHDPDPTPAPPEPEFSFCEPVTATSSSPWHIRRLTDAGRKLSGGADTDALCGRPISRMGWDLDHPVTGEIIDGINRNSSRRICDRCADQWRQESAL